MLVSRGCLLNQNSLCEDLQHLVLQDLRCRFLHFGFQQHWTTRLWHSWTQQRRPQRHQPNFLQDFCQHLVGGFDQENLDTVAEVLVVVVVTVVAVMAVAVVVMAVVVVSVMMLVGLVLVSREGFRPFLVRAGRQVLLQYR